MLASAVWVLIDAKRLGIKKGLVPGFFNLGPWAWFICCLLLWLIAFPSYLIMRPKYRRAIEAAKAADGAAIAQQFE